MHSLHFAGRYEEAVALARTYDHSDAGLAAMTEQDAWALNVEAYSLDRLGRFDEAETLFDRLVMAQKDNPDAQYWLINFAINRASRLVEMEKSEKGLDALTYAATLRGSPFADMLIRRDKICALNQLGRREEATELLSITYEKRKDSYTSAAQAHLCANQDDKAAAILIEGMSDEDARSEVVRRLQRKEFDLFYTLSANPDLYSRLRHRPDVARVFDQYGRDIPENFIPPDRL